MKDVSVVATVLRAPLHRQEAFRYRLELCSTEESRSWGAVLENLPSIVYLGPDNCAPGYSYSTQGAMQFWVTRESAGLREARGSNRRFDLSQSHELSAGGVLTAAEKQWAMAESHPAAEEQRTMLCFNHALLATGRGFSAFIDSVTSIRSSEAHLVVLEGHGEVYPGNRRTLRLEIDVEAGYLVRRAELVLHGLASRLIVESSGTIGTYPRTLASEGSLDWSGDHRTEVTIDSVEALSVRTRSAIEERIARIAAWPDRREIDYTAGRDHTVSTLYEDGELERSAPIRP